MRILMTGFTPRAVNSQKLLYSYMSNADVIRKTLERGGHTVDHRIVDVGEEGLPDRYDAALVGIAVPQSLSSRYIYGALWAAEVFGDRTRLYCDDWLLHQFKSQLESGIRGQEKRFFSLDNRHGFEKAKELVPIWDKWFNKLAYGKYRLLLPAFPFAKPRRMLPKLDNVEPVIFDPSPLALVDPQILCGSTTGEGPVLRWEDPEDRERTWTLAAMRDVGPWLKKQCFSWPVQEYGNKRKGQDVIPEMELLSIYCKRWGIIGAPYPILGSGGWRVRYLHAAVTGSILFLDGEDARVAGKPYDIFKTIVEKASPDELASIAAKQREHLLANIWNLDQLTDALSDYVKV